VKWASSKGFVDVDNVVSRYLRSIKKGRLGAEAKVNERPQLQVKVPKERSSVRYFGWRGDQEAVGAAWYCRECKRTTLVQVLGPLNSEVSALAEQVLTTFQDHPPGDWTLWALYGFRCEVPNDFMLCGQELLTGLLRLNFERGRTKLSVTRWGLADVALQKSSLEEFLRAKNRKNWRHYKLEIGQAEVHGHKDALVISGISAAPFAHMAGVALRLVGWRWANSIRGAAWLCPQTNKVFHVEAVVDPTDEQMVAEVIERVHCHDGGAQDK
jgi:flavin-dependent dehydrogenase